MRSHLTLTPFKRTQTKAVIRHRIVTMAGPSSVPGCGKTQDGIPTTTPVNPAPGWAVSSCVSKHCKSCLDTQTVLLPQTSILFGTVLKYLVYQSLPATPDVEHPFLCNWRCDTVAALGSPAHFCGSCYPKAEKHSSRQKHISRAGAEAAGGEGRKPVRQKGTFWCNQTVKPVC